ncbi:hypothetical protein OJAV_G00220460 [Oryzias javanicus]|uniref:ZP domain-containing protein n=1 Tax=Oryzias javanicus TaxID=123683 RepID=A0A437C0T4_ORYJA|nr:hypothetical protein OJAV_G00220460 [Oryzias javanicus]
MNSLEYSFVFFILVPHSFGRCFDMSFSICWMGKDGVLERQNGDVFFNGTSLKSVMKAGKVSSLKLFPVVENKLAFQYGGSTLRWTITVTPRTKTVKITGRHKPSEHPTNATKDFLALRSPAEVFACENGTTFFHQDENFFLAVGHTSRFPMKLEGRSPTMLLVSWVEMDPSVLNTHSLTVYHKELGSFSVFTKETTDRNHHRFSALEPCSRYLVCVEVADSHSFTCLSAITDPDVPKDFEVTSWNSSSISLSWDCPVNMKYSLFLLTVFYLNGTDHVWDEVSLWLTDDTFEFTLSDMQPCSRVKFGLQTVCQAGLETRYSKILLNDGNSGHSNIDALLQTSFGPDNYTLSWEVGNISFISMFRVYHQGELQGTTLLTSYTVGGLLPCHKYQAKVEALCGENVLMNAKTVAAHTGPRGVSGLRYRSNDSMVVWTPSSPQQTAVAYIYELSLENGPVIQRSRLSHTQLPLPGLEEGKSYVLDVWEECGGRWESEPSHLCFEGANSSFQINVRAAEFPQDPELALDYDRMGLVMVVPWALPKDLKEELRNKLGHIFTKKMQELLKDFSQPVRVELESFEAADDPQTEVWFQSFDASRAEKVPLPVSDQLHHIEFLKDPNITVKDGVIYWNAPDLCASSQHHLCPPHSMCINTLGSFSCVCDHGYHDVSSVMAPAAALRPVCKEGGLFSQCLEKAMMGGIAKAYLTSQASGNLQVKLNDGRCSVNETEELFFFHVPRKSSQCGSEKQVNGTHITLQNTLSITLKERTISRRDLKVVWKCVYPRHYVSNARVASDTLWLSSIYLVEFNSSLSLGLSMTLFRDGSFTHSYKETVSLGFEDTLFFQVSLQANSTFASDVLLQVESCWATESPDPQDEVQAVLLLDSCPADDTFLWLSVNGRSQTSRFSIQMFSMPKRLPIYFHCLANICGPDEDCAKSCTSEVRSRRSVRTEARKRAAVVSAGPLVVDMRGKSVQPSVWSEHMTAIFIVAASISFLGLTVLSLSAAKAIMTYFEQQQQ